MSQMPQKHLPAQLTIQTILLQPGRTAVTSPSIKTPDLSVAWCPIFTKIGGQLNADTEGVIQNSPQICEENEERRIQEVASSQQYPDIVTPLPSLRIEPNFKLTIITHESLAHILRFVSKSSTDLEKFIVNFKTTTKPQTVQTTLNGHKSSSSVDGKCGTSGVDVVGGGGDVTTETAVKSSKLSPDMLSPVHPKQCKFKKFRSFCFQLKTFEGGLLVN